MAEASSSPNSILELLNKLDEAAHESQRSGSALASPERKESWTVSVLLEMSRQKFRVWTETWLKKMSDPGMSGEKLWGDKGWREIQGLLGVVQGIAQDVENELMKKDDKAPRLGWRYILRSSQTRKNRREIIKCRPLLDLATHLSGSIDELWTCSETTLDSRHGVLSNQTGPHVPKELLARSLYERTASVALYEACAQSKADYSLDINLLGESDEIRNVFHGRNPVSSIEQPGLTYHFFAEARDDAAKVSEITVKSVSARVIEQHSMNSKITKFDFEASDLAVRESWPLFELATEIISISSQIAVTPSYFQVPRPPIELDWDAETESLAQHLYKGRVSDSQPLAQEARVQLAFKVVECGFHLIGTPWLAILSSRRLRKANISGVTRWILQVQTLDLEDVYFEHPDALSEHSQLFSLGVILVEIALGKEMSHQDSQSMRDPNLRASKVLPLVERSMGSLYRGATAFCLADSSSLPHFDLPGKYRDPEGTGWTAYLKALLEDYHAQVFSR